MRIINQTHSDWSSLVVKVPKTDGLVWFCVDFRNVSAVSKFVFNLNLLPNSLTLGVAYWHIFYGCPETLDEGGAQQVKVLFFSSLLLHPFDFSFPFVQQIDMTDIGLGTTFSTGGGVWRAPHAVHHLLVFCMVELTTGRTASQHESDGEVKWQSGVVKCQLQLERRQIELVRNSRWFSPVSSYC